MRILCRLGIHDWVPVGYYTRNQPNRVGVMTEFTFGVERCPCGARKDVDITRGHYVPGKYQRPRYPMADENGKPYGPPKPNRGG